MRLYVYTKFWKNFLIKIKINLILSFVDLDSVEFDNSFSYVRSKKVWYKFTIEAPSDSDAAWEEFDRVQS